MFKNIVLAQKWESLTKDYTANPSLRREADQILTDIIAAYGSPNRFYHNLQHLVAIFEHLAPFAGLFAHPNDLIWAVFFHDIIYDTQKHDNELQSALYARRALTQLNIPEAQIVRVENLIKDTQYHKTSDTLPEFHYFLDADLAILGSAPSIYTQYSQNIRKEYAWVPEALYKTGRTRVLQNLLAGPQLYQTPYFGELYEEQARRNMLDEIALLKN